MTFYSCSIFLVILHKECKREVDEGTSVSKSDKTWTFDSRRFVVRGEEESGERRMTDETTKVKVRSG